MIEQFKSVEPGFLNARGSVQFNDEIQRKLPNASPWHTIFPFFTDDWSGLSSYAITWAADAGISHHALWASVRDTDEFLNSVIINNNDEGR